MQDKINNKGNALILVSIILPILIMVIGVCLDGSLVLYSQSKLMAATKFAALSASSHNKVIEDKTIINATEDEAKSALLANYDKAKLKKFTIDESSKNKCTVVAEVKVNFVFMKMFGINSKTINESYTVTRKS